MSANHRHRQELVLLAEKFEQSLLRADGYYNTGYRDLADVIKHVSAQLSHDLLRLYRQMVFKG